MATARELFDSGKLNQAIEALSAELRDHPSDTQRRSFLFELLCFSGNWERADKQLDVLAGADKDKRMGALLYRAAINAERTREEMFRGKAASDEVAPQEAIPLGARGALNGVEFESIEDADPRIGARLEVLAGINYMWVPFEHITLIEMQPPKRLRDLLWAPAVVHTGPGFQGSDLGEVLLPVLCPLSATHADDLVKLGRLTVWEGDIPFGQKMLLAGGEEIPLLELRRLEDPSTGGQLIRMPIDLEALLQPISAEQPSGADLRYQPITDQIKEARRTEDDLAQGVWKRDVKTADYAVVIKLSKEALIKRSKDLQIAAWLLEALLHTEKNAGLRQGLELLQKLLEGFWDTVYPQIDEDGDLEYRATPLRWVGSQLDRAVRSVPLTQAGHNWYQYRESRTIPTEEESRMDQAKLRREAQRSPQRRRRPA